MTKNKSLEASLRSVLATDVSRIDPVPRAKEEIHQSLLSLIPEKKYDTDANDLRAGTFKRGQDKYRVGYNQAIRDFEKSVREWVNRHYSPK